MLEHRGPHLPVAEVPRNGKRGLFHMLPFIALRGQHLSLIHILGKTVEGIKTKELIPFLKETGNSPMHRYIRHTDLNDGIVDKYNFCLLYTSICLCPA